MAGYPSGGVNGGALFDQHVGDSDVTFLSDQVQRGQAILRHTRGQKQRDAARSKVKALRRSTRAVGTRAAPHLVPHIDVGLFGKEQSRDVGTALLSSQVQRRDALQRLGVGRGPVLQEAARHLDLVLLGGDVQRRVAVLRRHVSAEPRSLRAPARGRRRPSRLCFSSVRMFSVRVLR